MSDKPVFLIDGREYAIPSAFRLGDTVLIEEVTGLSYGAWTERLSQKDGNGKINLRALIGLVAAAVWQGNPDMERSEVLRFTERIDFESLASRAPEVISGPPAEAAEVPPNSTT